MGASSEAADATEIPTGNAGRTIASYTSQSLSQSILKTHLKNGSQTSRAVVVGKSPRKRITRPARLSSVPRFAFYAHRSVVREDLQVENWGRVKKWKLGKSVFRLKRVARGVKLKFIQVQWFVFFSVKVCFLSGSQNYGVGAKRCEPHNGRVPIWGSGQSVQNRRK